MKKKKTKRSAAETHGGEQIERNCEKFRAGNRHGLLALLTDDLNERFRFFRTVVPVTAVSGFHYGGTLHGNETSYENKRAFTKQTYFFDESVAEDTEVEHLS